jgi:hypothetical protein
MDVGPSYFNWVFLRNPTASPTFDCGKNALPPKNYPYRNAAAGDPTVAENSASRGSLRLTLSRTAVLTLDKQKACKQ